MEYWLRLLAAGGVERVLINTHYLAQQVRNFIVRSDFASYVTLVHEAVLLGTAGTLLCNRDFFGGEPVILIHGDNLSLFDMRAFTRLFVERPMGVEITMMTFETDAPETCGIVQLDPLGIVRDFSEKSSNPKGNLANGAVYIVSSVVVDFLAGLDKEIIDFSTEVLPHFIGRINTFHNDIYHRDIGTPESLATAQGEFKTITERHARLLE